MLKFINKKNENDKAIDSSQRLLFQINSRWTKRIKSDAELVDNRVSKDLTISKDLNGCYNDSGWLFNQLVAYCKNKRPGSVRISVIQNGDEIVSGNHTLYFWQPRNWKEDIGNNIKVTFNTRGESDSMQYDIPILVNGEPDIWSGEKPFFDRIMLAINTGSADRSVWNLACRLKELGFIEESVLPEGRQKYPKNAIRNLQDYMGIDRTEYNEQLHRLIWGEFRLSIDTP
jgi:hypothetical protein